MSLDIVGTPWLQILLLAIVFLGLLVEIKTGGLGAGAMLSIVAAGVFFGSHYMKGLVSMYQIAMFLGGVMCIIIEMLTPTVGLIAGLGAAAMLYSVVLTLGGDLEAIYALLASLALAVLIFALLVKRLPSSRLWKKVVLSHASTSDRGYVSAPSKQNLVGRTGVAETDLRPSGRGNFDGVSQDIVTDGAYIVKGSSIIVASVEGSRVIVKKI
ncbi:MAG: serine protease [Schwartzia sp.]|nr:serine protease [Schwartzia sp. (in: firmicutes)]